MQGGRADLADQATVRACSLQIDQSHHYHPKVVQEVLKALPGEERNAEVEQIHSRASL